MPVFEITSPKGERFEITAPEGATEQQVLEYAQSQFQSTGTEDAMPTPQYGSEVPEEVTDYTAQQPKRELTKLQKGINFVGDVLSGGGQQVYSERPTQQDLEYEKQSKLKAAAEVPVQLVSDIASVVSAGAGTAGDFVADGEVDIPFSQRFQNSIFQYDASKKGQNYYQKTLENLDATIGLNELSALGRLKAIEGAPLTTKPLPKLPKFQRAIREKDIIASDKLLDKFELEAADAISKGIKVEDVKPFVLNKIGVNENQINKAAQTANRKVYVPKTEAEVKALNEIKTISEYKEPNMVSKALQPITSRLRNISEEAANRLRRYEFNIHNNTQKYMNTVMPFMQTLKSLPKAQQNKITLDLYNGRFNQVRQQLQDINPQSVQTFDATENALKTLYKELQESGFDIGKVENYFPRRINDLEGLYAQLGIKQKGQIESLLQNKANKLGVSRKELSDEDIAQTINNYLRGYGAKSQASRPFFTKGRAIQEVDENILQFYSDPIDVLQNYIRSSVNSIEKRKFFGQNAVVKGGRQLDIDKSIGNLIADDIPAVVQDEVSAILRARFNAGEQAPSVSVRWAKDFIYLSTLANPKSAITQLGDLGMSAILNGNKNAIASLLKTKAAKLEDLGLADDIAAELQSVSGLSKALNSALKYTGFKSIDRLGKEVLINSSLKKAKQMVRSKTGEAAFRNKYGKVFGDEYDSLVADLKADKMTDNVKYYMFNELSDAQPITLSEMPRWYLENPNGRVVYALKTFTLKQLDIMKRRIYDEWRAGNKKTAVRNAAAYVTIMSATNTGADQLKKVIQGREVNVEDIPDEMVFNILKMFGGSEYVYNNYISKGKLGEAVIETVAPPLDLLFTVAEDGIRLASEEDTEFEKLKSPRQIPVIGWIIHNWFQGGLEKYNERQEKKRYE